MPSIMKQCLPISHQEWLESRRLWRKVTRAILEQDPDRANREKLEIENRHRNEPAQPSYFRLKDDLWEYTGCSKENTKANE